MLLRFPPVFFLSDGTGKPDCGDISPLLGSTSTPVIDPSTGTIYVEAYSYESGTYVHRLHALDITTGAEKTFGPATIAGTVVGTGDGGSTVTFNPYNENDRPALTLVNGTVYLAFAASCADQVPFHGWVFAYDASTLTQQGIFLTTPNGSFGGIWMTGDGLAADASGNIYTSTGNGDFDTLNIPATDVGDSVLKLTLNNGILNLADYFTPYDQETLSDEDKDVASGGILLLPDQPGPFPHEMVAAGKEGRIYLINRDQFTTGNQHYCANCSSDPQIVQESASGYINGMFSTPAYWNSTLYYWSPNLYLKAIPMANGLLNFNSVSDTQDAYGWPGANLSVSANGNSNGILWALKTDAFSTGGAAVLRAYDATNVSNRLYSSDVNPNDAAGPAVKFTVPMVANGKVYVGSADQLTAYGPSGATPTPTSSSTPSATPTPSPTANPTTTTAATLTPMASPTLTLVPTPSSLPTGSPTATLATTPTASPTATQISLFGTATRTEVGYEGVSASVTLPGGGETVSSATLVLVQCFVRAGNPSVTPAAGWTSFASSIDSTDVQYLIYKLYPANSTIDSSVALAFDGGGVSFAEIEAIAYQGVSGIDVGPLETHSTNSSTSTTAPAITTVNDDDTIVWFYSSMLPFSGTVSAVSAGSMESHSDASTAPANAYGCQAVAALGQGTQGTEAAQSMTCSAAEDLNSGIVVALASATAPTVTPSSSPSLSPALSPTPALTPSPSFSPSNSPSPSPSPLATPTANPTTTTAATLTPMASPTLTLVPTPSSLPTGSPTATLATTPTASPTATQISLFGTATRTEVGYEGVSASVTLPGGGETVSSATLVLVQCFVRAGNPSVTPAAGWTSFASSIDSTDVQYLIYKLYPANSTIDSSVALAFDGGGVSFAEIEAIAYQGVSGIDVGPLETHSTNSSTSTTAPAITTVNDDDTIVWFYSSMLPFSGTVSAVSAGSMESHSDASTAPANAYGCQAVAALGQGTQGTEAAQSMTCSAAEDLNSGIVVALASATAPTVTPSSSPSLSPALSPTPALTPSPSFSPSNSPSPSPSPLATPTANPTTTTAATLTPMASPTLTLVPTPSSLPTGSPTATLATTPTASPTATQISLFGTATRTEVGYEGVSASVTLPGGGETVSSATLVLVQCFVRAGNPSVTPAAGWTSFASSIDSTDVQYLIYKLYPANSTIDSSVALAFDGGGVSFAEIEAIAYQGVSGIDVGPLETHSTNSSTSTTAPAITTVNDDDTIVWFYSSMLPFSGTVSAVSAGSMESHSDASTAPANAYGCQAVAALGQGTQGTEAAQSMTCSAAEDLNSGIVVALASATAPTVTPSPSPSLSPALSPTPALTPSPSFSPSNSPSPSPSPLATPTANPTTTTAATLTPMASPTLTLVPTPSSLPTGSPTATLATTPTASPTATQISLFGTATRTEVGYEGVSASVTLPGGGETVSSATLVLVQCFVRAGNPSVTPAAGWTSFASSIDSTDVQYLIYKLYPANSTIDSSVALAFDGGGVSFAEIEAIAYQGVSEIDVGPLETHSTNSSTSTMAPAITTVNDGDTIVWFYSSILPFSGTVSAVSAGTMESHSDASTAPANAYGCQAIAALGQGTQGTEAAQSMTCSAAEDLNSGIVVALASATAPTVTPSPSPSLSPALSPTPALTPSPSFSPSNSPSPSPSPLATPSASPSPA